ncbi:MAG: hypothetical protein R3359_05850 [Marinirhabdus sp.]|nr:hypothetical protein [Marinirhabdus sp.]
MLRTILQKYVIALFLISSSLCAQTNSMAESTDVDIVKVYEQVIKEGYPSVQIYKELAMAQYFRSNYSEAKKWFEAWFKIERPKDQTALHRYRQTLKALKVSVENNEFLGEQSEESN